jgi:2-phospho-L-lactate guanylyltransferase (CobY/MobA/RfbA family)
MIPTMSPRSTIKTINCRIRSERQVEYRSASLFSVKICGLSLIRWCAHVVVYLLATISSADSLLLHYSFDGSSVDDAMLAVDSSGNGYDASMTGYPSGAGDVPITVGGGDSWRGTRGDWIDPDVVDPNVLAPTNYTIAFWAKPDLHAATVIACSRAIDYPSAGTALYTRGDGGFRFYHNGSEVITDVEAGVVFDTEKWTHVAVTVDTVNDMLALYVNGVLRHSESTALAPMDEGLSRVGSSKVNLGGVQRDPINDSYQGLLDDFRFYDYPLTAAYVKDLAGLPLLHYSFDGSTADVNLLAIDSSENSYDGIVAGSPVGSSDVSSFVGAGDSWLGVRGDWMDLDVVDPNVLAPTNYTIAFWAKPDVYASTVIACSRAVDYPSAGTALYTRGGGGLRFYHNGSQVITEAEAGVVFDTEKWTHVAVTVDTVNDTLALYVNGVLRHSESTALAPLAEGLSRIGSSKSDLGAVPRDPFGDTYQGLLDEFYLYGYVMNPDQVQALTKITTFVMYAPNGDTIPRVLGANGTPAVATGFDYFDWFGITHRRTWYGYKGFSTLPDDGSVDTPTAFDQAVADIRADPWRQATANDIYIDWVEFDRELEKYDISDELDSVASYGIEQMITNDELISETTILTGDWSNTFTYWKSWYAMVYYMASQYDVSMYQMDNEPNSNYDAWESHWLVAADAMRKAMDDVNTDYNKNMTLYICGPVTAGVWWDDELLDPDVNPRGWSNVSWNKIKYDIYGNYNVSNPWNYGMFDYHRYTSDASLFEGNILNARYEMATAANDPNVNIPIVITEMNSKTGAGSREEANDTEDLFIGIGIAQLLQVTGSLGQEGLGQDGGLFVFKLGSAEWQAPPLTGIENRFCYVSSALPGNYGGITRGGATFQMYSNHFGGGKEIVPFSAVNGTLDDRHRVVSAVDADKNQYYIYGSNLSETDDAVVYDFNNLDVASGAPITVQRVDANNTGQITEIIQLGASKKLAFSVPDLSAYLITVPKGSSTVAETIVEPTDDRTQNVIGDDDVGGTNTNMMVSLHHIDETERRAALVRFNVSDVDTMGRALLKLSGRNAGVDLTEREILHVYAVSDEVWDEGTHMSWTSAPGVGSYITDLSYTPQVTWATATGLGDMIDIEDNYGGVDTNGVHTGSGLGIHGQFVGAVSFYSSDYQSNYLDVTDYIKSVASDSVADVTFVVARIVRYNVNYYDNPYSYTLGNYHYDGRIVEIASKENADASLHPALVVTSGTAPNLVSVSPVIDSYSLDASGDFVVQVSGLGVGTEYFLMKDTDLSDGAMFDVAADSVTASSTTEILTDVDAGIESDRAFYRVTD